jgi:hypothetical protein
VNEIGWMKRSMVMVVVGTLVLARDAVADGARVEQLVAQATTAAHAGQCSVVRALAPHIREQDAARYQSFAAEPSVAGCLPAESTPIRLTAGTERDRFLVGGGVGVGTALVGDVWLGWMILPDLGISLSGMWSGESIVSEGSETFRLLAVGARYWFAGRVFVDARVGAMHGESFTSDAGHRSNNKLGGYGGLGVELISDLHGALELRVGLASSGSSGASGGLFGGLAVSFY